MRRIVTPIAILGLILWSTLGTAQNASQGASSAMQAVTEKQEKPWSMLIGADQYFGFYSDTGQYTELTLNPSYKLNDRNTFTIVQAIDKYYEIPSVGGKEVDFSDTSLRHIYLLNNDLYGWNLKWRTSATLPLSSVSRESGNITRAAGMVIASRKFFDIFTFTYRPYLSYSFNQYTTTVGGMPLRRASLGHYVEGQIDFTDKLNLFSMFFFSYTIY